MEQEKMSTRFKVVMGMLITLFVIIMIASVIGTYYFLTLDSLTGFQMFLKILCIILNVMFGFSILFLVFVIFAAKNNKELTDEELEEMKYEQEEMKRMYQLKKRRDEKS